MTLSRSDQVAAEVRAETARQRLSQGKLAEKLGMSESSVSLRLSGRIEFKVSELLAFADVLAVPVTQFLPTAVTAERVA